MFGQPPDNRIHATFTFPVHLPTTEERLGIERREMMSFTEFLERIGIEYIGRPLDRGNVTMLTTNDQYIEICVAWEVEEEIGECYDNN